jgi:hypothetical protein
MNSQELRNLKETYNQVYELDEISQKTATNAFATRATGEFEYDTNPSDYTKSGKSKADETKRRIEKKHGKAAGQHAERAAHARIFGRKKTALTSMPPKPTKTNEAVDLYDIILSHLLDEGYADTQEAAEAIMVNMSEDWRESIVEKRESDEPGERDDRPDVKAHNNAVKYRPRSRKPRIEDDPRFGTPRDEGGNWKY